MKKLSKLCLVVLAVVGLHQANAQNVEKPVALGSSKSLLSSLQQKSSSRGSGVELSGLGLAATVNFQQSTSSSALLMGSVDGGSFVINATDHSLEGHVILKDAEKAYKYYSDEKGNAFVTEVDIHSLICVNKEDAPASEKAKAAQRGEAVQIAADLLNLQSLPGAAGCVMLDFDGYYMPAGNYWNNGNAISAAHSNMSDADVRQHWEVVAEDYRPFNVNITTSESVFNSYPRNRRMRVVVTPTNTAAPGAGGVAYLGSFNWDNDVPCWVFITSGKSGGDASSHEIGHCFDLQHDGRSNPDEGYFLGIDGTAWAPIMGAGYYRPIVQWSKGEYRYAKNDKAGVLQDDVATIAGSKFGVGYRADDYGNNTGSASNLSYNASGVINEKYGIISSAADIDFFAFTTGGGRVTMTAKTVGRDQNAHLVLRLYNADGGNIGNYWDPNTFATNASMDVTLAAGKYYVAVDGSGAGDAAYGGYSDYGSIGSFWLNGNIPPGGTVANSDGHAVVYKDCAFGGYAIGLDEGDYTRAALIAKGISDDDISSLKVKQGYKVIVYRDDNYTGASATFTGDDDCLVNEGFNDVITSVRVQTNGITGKNGTYFLQNRHSSLYLDVPGSSMEDGAQLQQYTLNSSGAQQFTLADLGGGVYTVKNVTSGRVMDVDAIKKEDGVKVQQWGYAGSRNQQWILVEADGGFYKFVARHSAKIMEIGGWSTVERGLAQQWTNNNQASGQWKLVPIQAVVGNGDGLNGNYFNGMNFETARLTRKDATVNFNWGNGSPDASVNADGFSVRWTGQVQPKYSGEYTFYVNSDNGRRLWINNQLVIDKWIDDWNVDYNGKIVLTAGQKYDIKLEYFENYGGAAAKLEWSSALQGREVVPTSQLYSPAVTTNPNPQTNQAPTVSLTSPSNNAGFNAPATVTVSANASDSDGSIAKVEFFRGTTKVGEDASAPYSYTITGLAAGSYSLSAKATDNKGAVTTSGSVSITVTIVAVDNCSGVAQYTESAGYVAGSKVKNNGRRYECKEWPYSGWCNAASWAYAPGTGSAWTDAWYDKGSCTPTTGGADNVSSSVDALTIAPNPVAGEMKLSSSYDLTGATLSIVDITGQSVFQSQASASVNIADLNAGIYTLIVVTENGEKITKRFVKIK